MYFINLPITDFTHYLTAFRFLHQELISDRYSSCCSSRCCSPFWSDLFKKNSRLRHFQWDRDEIWQDCSSSKYASIDVVGLLILRHTFKMATMTSFHEKVQKLLHKIHKMHSKVLKIYLLFLVLILQGSLKMKHTTSDQSTWHKF